MELYQLRSFVTVADEKHLTRAAQRLYTSQPAVSAHIKALEEELGVPLFIRTPKGMELTREGQLLKAQAEKCLASINELFHQAQWLQNDLAGMVKIGVNTYPDTLKIGEFFSIMTENYPKLEIHLLQRNSWQILDEIRNGSLDAGYIYGSNPFEVIEILSLQTCHLVVVGPARWKNEIENADLVGLAEFPWIWADHLCPFRRYADALFQQQHIQPIKVAIADQEATLENLVTAGVGLTLMIEREALAEKLQGKIAIWHKERFAIDLSFAYLHHRKTDPILQAILEAIYLVWMRADRYTGNRHDLSF